MQLTLLTPADLRARPEPDWIVEGLIQQSSLGVLYGSPGVGKSFVALDIANRVAAGLPWHGRAVARRRVLFLAAEGGANLGRRQAAWQANSGLADDPETYFFDGTVDLLDPEWVAAAALKAREIGAGLVIVDTLARSMGAGDENSARDMNAVLAACERIRGDGAVLLVHHPGRDNIGRERGHSSLRGAADWMVSVTRKRGSRTLTLACEKMKDTPEWTPISMRLEGHAESSAVVPAAAVPDTDPVVDRVVEAIAATPGIGKGAVRDAVRGVRGSVVDAALDRALSSGKVENRPSGGGFHYFIVSDKPGQGSERTVAAPSVAQTGAGPGDPGRVPPERTPVGGALGTPPDARERSAYDLFGDVA